MTLRILLTAFALPLMLSVPVEAQTTVPERSDCVEEVRAQRQAAVAAGTPLTRSEQKALLLACQNRELETYITEQERAIAALNAEIDALGLRVDENQRILDANNQIIGFIEEIDGQLTLQRELEADIARINADIARINADTERMLAEAERILMRLATQ